VAVAGLLGAVRPAPSLSAACQDGVKRFPPQSLPIVKPYRNFCRFYEKISKNDLKRLMMANKLSPHPVLFC
jgi:hypothetical protein